jgi:hypothetical protein
VPDRDTAMKSRSPKLTWLGGSTSDTRPKVRPPSPETATTGWNEPPRATMNETYTVPAAATAIAGSQPPAESGSLIAAP